MPSAEASGRGELRNGPSEEETPGCNWTQSQIASTGGSHHSRHRVTDEARLLVALDLEGEAGDDLPPSPDLATETTAARARTPPPAGTGAGKRIL
jgi:hypothetical protein